MVDFIVMLFLVDMGIHIFSAIIRYMRWREEQRANEIRRTRTIPKGIDTHTLDDYP